MPIVRWYQDKSQVPEGALNVRPFTHKWNSYRQVCPSGVHASCDGETEYPPHHLECERACGRNEIHVPESKETWLFDEYVGLCLFETERNGYDDSDFYMTVWDEENQRPKVLEFGTTRGYCGPAMSSRPDATPEVWEKYRAWEAAEYERRRAEYERRLALEPAKGKMIKVVRGRKVAKGTTGVCVWRGERYGEDRVGLRADDGTVYWTASKNVEVTL